jgi:predicted  nucleic acid-binding Zn-ribbon protein
MHADLERSSPSRSSTPPWTRPAARATPGTGESVRGAPRTDADTGVPQAKARLAENQSARRTVEKDVALHQSRLSKFRETAMAVKTNQEYHAVQKEIAFAQTEIKTLEDKILEQMIEADELTAALKKAEQDPRASRRRSTPTAGIAAEHVQLQTAMDR